MNSANSDLTRAFESHDIGSRAFAHRDHLGVAYDMLGRYDFMEAAVRYAQGIRTIATKAGAPKKFNATVTFAFMSLIAERMAKTEHADFDDFVAQNPVLLSKDLLERWYSPERLGSDFARKIFLMPDARG